MAMNDSIGDRMKRYERVSNHVLVRRMPVIVRVDGRAFHTFTRAYARPFDARIINWMVAAAKAVFKDMQGCKLAYVQSDEASFLLTDYDTHETQAWFDNELQKIVSISAALMSGVFTTRYIAARIAAGISIDFQAMKPPMFDSRAFNVPREEVANYFLWRAKDWERNSLQMYARANFSHKELQNKNSADIHEMLHAKGLNWAMDLTAQQKNGTWIRHTANTVMSGSTIKPTYEDIANAVDPLLAPAIVKEDA